MDRYVCIYIHIYVYISIYGMWVWVYVCEYVRIHIYMHRQIDSQLDSIQIDRLIHIDLHRQRAERIRQRYRIAWLQREVDNVYIYRYIDIFRYIDSIHIFRWAEVDIHRQIDRLVDIQIQIKRERFNFVGAIASRGSSSRSIVYKEIVRSRQIDRQ